MLVDLALLRQEQKLGFFVADGGKAIH
jgi:hypothetical protein